MPVSPATVREAFLHEKPSAPDEPANPMGLAKEDRDGESGDVRSSRTRRLLLGCACIAAFLVGFAAVTLLMYGSDSGANPRPSTTPTSAPPGPVDQDPQAPAPSLPTRAAVPAPPTSAPAGNQPAPASPAPSPPGPAPIPRAEDPRAPAPTTSASAPSTSPTTTTPVTTAP